MIERVGIRVPLEAKDPAADAARAERLGFGHVAVDAASATAIMLVLGATRSLRIAVVGRSDLTGSRSSLLNALLEGLPASRAARVDMSPTDPVLCLDRVDLDDRVGARARIAQCASGSVTGAVTIELPLEDHGGLVLDLALDVLTAGLEFRDGPLRGADDLQVGEVIELGEVSLSEDDIIAFAEQWDPLDFHIDSTRAKLSPLGVICASGIHTQAAMQRLAAKGMHRNLAIVAGRGMLGMRLFRPVEPGMTLTGKSEVVMIEPHKGGRALVTVTSKLWCAGDLLMEQTGQLVLLRSAADDPRYALR